MKSNRNLVALLAASLLLASACAETVENNCKTGDHQCNGNNLQICVNNEWNIQEVCTYGCENNACKQDTGFVPASCTAGDVKCEGNAIVQCNGSGWVTMQNCPLGCTNGTCNTNSNVNPGPVACTAGDVKCEGNAIVQCNGSSWVAMLNCPYGCLDGSCVSGGNPGVTVVCNTGDVRCNGKVVELCMNNAWTSSKTCDNACENGSCVGNVQPNPQNCDSGSKKCEGNQVMACVNGEWVASGTCGYQCNNGVCIDDPNGGEEPQTPIRPADVPASCVKGSSPAVCASDGNAWFCGKDGTYYLNSAGTCTADKPCTVCENGFGGCGITCNGGGGTTKPSNLPASCVKGTSPAFCANDGNAWFCGSDGTYYLNSAGTCSSDKLCTVCENGFGGCGITCNGGGGNVNPGKPADLPASCVKGTSPAFCASDGNAWFCGSDGTYYLNAAGTCGSKACVVCENGFGGCGITCNGGGGNTTPTKPADVPASCVKGTSPAFCASDGNAWFCGKDGYYLNAAGTCGNKPCVVCSNGYGGCGITCKEGGGNETPTKPADVPASCVKGTSPAFCASDGNAWFCGDNGYYLNAAGTCGSKPCVVCENGYGGCGITCNGGTNPTKPADVPASCVKGTSPAFCASDGNAWFCGDNGYYLNAQGTCGDKPCVVCDNGFGGCGITCNGGTNPTKPADVPASCVKGTSPAFCASDGNAWFCGDNGYYLNAQGTCGDKECVVCKNGYGGCGITCKDDNGGSECAETGGNVGDCCDANYKPSCTNGGANALICSSGKIKQWDCANNQCSYDAGTNKVTCPKDGGGSECAETGGNVGDCCDANYKPSCTNGGANALICSSGKIKQWDCANNQCSYDAGTNKVSCQKDDNGGGNGGDEVGSSCDANSYKKSCINNGANALICQGGKVVQWTCANNGCVYDEQKNYITCPKEENGGGSECVETGGKVGDCCDSKVYKPSCINNGANALICSSGKIKQWSCSNTCSYDAATNKVDCQK